MRLLPRDEFIIKSDKSPDELQKILKSQTASEKPVVGNTEKPFWGWAASRQFELRPCITYWNSFLPVIRGEVTVSGTGTNIKISMGLESYVKGFLILWLVVCSLFILTGLSLMVVRQDSRIKLLPFSGLSCILLVYGSALSGFCFRREAKKARIKLYTLLS